jgi:hypothetical protein
VFLDRVVQLLSVGVVQLAGRNCKVCGEKIVFADEARLCSNCGTVVHLWCHGSVCSACGSALSGYTRPRADALRDAIVPRTSRPDKTGAAAFAILFIFLLVLLALYVISLA